VPFVANKKFRLSAEDIGRASLLRMAASQRDRIVVDGRPVGYMYRDDWGVGVHRG
jgi:hypothetical protein